ncbi:APC family permease [Spongiivirga citrea]|uniref:Uncharacterized protein n=1 Tax=Spongiivirga citrea TaxID=1481457 RepID=A0A6M0CJ66_9FLAO|nr:hypothetical protein [Spongiivirga citrea]NER15969.1 hypothetical protein [Spongiivirga citrea]
MSTDYTKTSFKKLLEKLQEESWQLELIISGFAIFGLFTALDPIGIAATEARNVENPAGYITLNIALISCFILLFNLLLHVILRGLWIGALGLRYVSGDIDYEALNYSPKFTKYLQKKIGSFDRYIGTLENYCSVIFAISFLLIFYVFSFTLIILCIFLVANYIISSDDLPGYISNGLGIPLLLFIVFGMLLTFFDFITQGWLKKKQWISKIYFPVYWVFSFITLSFLYRPLVYNFLDHKFGKRLSFILVPLYIIILFASSLYFKNSNYFETSDVSNSIYANNRNYENLLEDKDDVFINRAAIPSKVITKPYLQVFIVYDDGLEDAVFDFNQGIEPEEDDRGLHFDLQFNNGNNTPRRNRDSIKLEYLKTFNEIVTIKIDTVKYKSDFILAQSRKDELGFETFVNLKGLEEGKHYLDVQRKRIWRKDTSDWRIARIPFWYYKGQ